MSNKDMMERLRAQLKKNEPSQPKPPVSKPGQLARFAVPASGNANEPVAKDAAPAKAAFASRFGKAPKPAGEQTAVQAEVGVSQRKHAENQEGIPAEKPRFSFGATHIKQPAPTGPGELLPAPRAAAPDSLKELAALSTDNVKESVTPASKEHTQVERLKEAAMLEGPPGVRNMLDQLDSLIADDNDLSIVEVGAARQCVERIMVTLKENPEFDSVMVDKDVRNLLVFLRSVRGEAETIKTNIEKKRAKREQKPKAKGLVFEGVDLRGLALGSK